MKVKIGPYRSWIGPYQVAEKIIFWNENLANKLGDILAHGRIKPERKPGDITDLMEENPKTWFFKFLLWIDGLKQDDRKVYVHIDSYDTFSADHTIALIMAPLLKKLKEDLHGHPVGIDEEDAPGIEDDNDKWLHILDCMIWSFEQLSIDWEDQFYTGEPDLKFRVLENGGGEMFKGESNTFVCDEEGAKKHAEKIQHGLNLFAKYYRSLWT